MTDTWYEQLERTAPVTDSDTVTYYRDNAQARLDIATRSLHDLLEQTFSHYRSSISTDEQPEAQILADEPTVYVNDRLYQELDQFDEQYRLGEPTVPVSVDPADGRTIIDDHIEYDHVPDALDRSLQTTVDGTTLSWMAIETGIPSQDEYEETDDRLQFTHPNDSTYDTTIVLA